MHLNLFKSLNFSHDNNTRSINIKNIEYANGHWGSEKEIVRMLEEIDTLLYKPDDFKKNIVGFALDIKKHNPRVDKLSFYTDENQKLILFVVSDMRKFKDLDKLSREMNITCKNHNFSFSIVEMVNDEFKDLKEGEVMIPSNWKEEELLNKRLNRLIDYINIK